MKKQVRVWCGLIVVGATTSLWTVGPRLPAFEGRAVARAEGTVQVKSSGTRYDPPVKASEIPAGAWMCEMGGKVHYAAKERGDGKCPVCSMKLVQKGKPAEHDHSGHDHTKH